MPDTTDTGSTDLLASTGLNDPNSPWNINGLLQTGINIGNQELDRALQLQTPLNVSANGTPASQGGPAPAAPATAPAKLFGAKWVTYVAWAAAIALVAWVLLELKD
jgi:hypothetical protein